MSTSLAFESEGKQFLVFVLSHNLILGFGMWNRCTFCNYKRGPNLKMLGLSQGFAAGLMRISFLDLAHNAINSIGFLKGNLWGFAAGLMRISFLDLAHNAINSIGFLKGNLWLKQLHSLFGPTYRCAVYVPGSIFLAALLTIDVVSISLHNLPEGMAMFLGSIKGLHVDLNLALAIALHNIPEGVAVALPVYIATQSKWQAFKLATLSGFAEPFGVVVVAYLFPSSLNPEILGGLLGSVGGVVAFLKLHEMLPLVFDYAGVEQAVKAVFFGMAFMSASYFDLHVGCVAKPLHENADFISHLGNPKSYDEIYGVEVVSGYRVLSFLNLEKVNLWLDFVNLECWNRNWVERERKMAELGAKEEQSFHQLK
ncbi:Zinc/iron permease [Dillenia turbinata]|uniref:Zinc/iron permease n=1 Tax=Dillenia turbinata TaxID=194707 RepID=A0AAN8VZH1_9MAGN